MSSGSTVGTRHAVRRQAEQQFQAYCHAFPLEAAALTALALQLSEDPSDVVSRSNMRGHITTSALVIDPAAGKVLVIHHKLYDRWLQPGGHYEGTCALHASALREAEEETSVSGLQMHEWHQKNDAPFDIDSHGIKAQPKKNEVAHVHHDFIYLFTAESTAPLKAQEEEVFGANWISLADFAALPGTRFQRLANKWAAL